ncbi:MAG: S41 family peptidase [Candidatus Spechtbacterales bacterium]
MDKRILSFWFIIIILSLGFGGGFIIGKSSTAGQTVSDIRGLYDVSKLFSKKPSIDLIREGMDVIERKYVDTNNIKSEDLIYGAMNGMLKALKDPHSVFLEPEYAKTFKEDVGGKFEGIGAEIGIRDEKISVIAPLKGNPAEDAGVLAGDQILAIDGVETEGLSLDEAVRRIRGPKGSVVKLTILREGTEENFDISIVRDTIKIPNIEWEKKEGGIAYVSLAHFSETTSGDFEDVAQEILRSGAKKLILDLRNNPGGFLEVAVDIAGWFLWPDTIVLIEESGHGNSSKTYNTAGSAALIDYPTVILINKGSASASEILAGALRDHRNVKLIGEKSFGKGSVQELVNLSDGSSVKISISKWLTPKGISIQDNGLTPDIEVEMTSEIFDKKGDVQLEKAIEAAREL